MVRSARRPLAFAASAVLALSAAVGVAGTAQGVSSADTYTATVTPQVVDSGVAQTSFAVTITNSASSPDALGSAAIQFPSGFGNVSASVPPGVLAPGWSVNFDEGGTLHLVSSTSETDDDAQLADALQPGQSIVVTVVADTPSTSDIYSWTTSVQMDPIGDGPEGDDPADIPFTIAGSQPQIAVGLPDHLVFVGQPSDVQQTTSGPASYICPTPSVEAVTADGQIVTSGSATLNLLADTAFGDPGLGGTTSAATAAGLATFGSCSSGVDATNLGVGFKLKATGTWTNGVLSIPLATAADSSPFNVSQVVVTCAASHTCSGSTAGTHTGVSVTTTSATTTDQLEVAVGVDSFANTTCHPFFQPTGIQVTRVVANNRGKTVTLTFDRSIVSQKPLYLIFLFPVCFSATWGNWVTDTLHAPTLNPTTHEYEGLLPFCLPRFLPAGNPCVSSRILQRNGSEVVTVQIPFQADAAALCRTEQHTRQIDEFGTGADDHGGRFRRRWAGALGADRRARYQRSAWRQRSSQLCVHQRF